MPPSGKRISNNRSRRDKQHGDDECEQDDQVDRVVAVHVARWVLGPLLYGAEQRLLRTDSIAGPSSDSASSSSVLVLRVQCHARLFGLNGSTHAGHIRTSWGGVGRNVADCLSRLLGDTVRLVSAVGVDRNGEALLKHNPLLVSLASSPPPPHTLSRATESVVPDSFYRTLKPHQ
ncbi:hypothetical protein HPB52_022492 [Rhipicephalus sanguineus]|uniref:Carbohydrate kinase PfkB domain-containing protein n=1 Tax=Rhipicephalus sanguineus TaxID=34632 RepID=A0A9D4QAX5_RHISA|nr:hypothetical protein HPB52_022492 [Rhipicephalus sanguineus]